MRPEEIIDFDSARTYLRQFVPATTGKYTLDRMVQLMDYLGNPQDKLKVIHIAGTSGKTSTCYYVAALLHNAGCKVGHTVSPHVEEVNERAQINLSLLPEKEYCEELKKFAGLVEDSGTNPTYFELLVAFAFWLFEKRGVDYAVVEVGLGGLFDGTNVVNSRDKVCVITDIGFDHTDILGESLAEISAQKAGIIKPDNHVFMHEQTSYVNNVIQQVCSNQNAALIKIPKVSQQSYGLPPFQQRNFDLANHVADFVLGRDNRPAIGKSARKTAAKVTVPARMEIIEYKGKTVIIDGSHNEQKIAALVEGVTKKFPGHKISLLVSFGDNKASIALANLELLRALSESITLTSFTTQQDGLRLAITPENLADLSRLAGFRNISTEADPQRALRQALEPADDILLITGSYFLLNHLRPVLVHSR